MTEAVARFPGSSSLLHRRAALPAPEHLFPPLAFPSVPTSHLFPPLPPSHGPMRHGVQASSQPSPCTPILQKKCSARTSSFEAEFGSSLMVTSWPGVPAVSWRADIEGSGSQRRKHGSNSRKGIRDYRIVTVGGAIRAPGERGRGQTKEGGAEITRADQTDTLKGTGNKGTVPFQTVRRVSLLTPGR